MLFFYIYNNNRNCIVTNYTYCLYKTELNRYADLLYFTPTFGQICIILRYQVSYIIIFISLTYIEDFFGYFWPFCQQIEIWIWVLQIEINIQLKIYVILEYIQLYHINCLTYQYVSSWQLKAPKSIKVGFYWPRVIFSNLPIIA